MEMNIVLFKALGLTLLHSVWQATVIAVIMSVILFIIPRKKASLRYFIALISLFVAFIASLITFLYTYQPQQLTQNTMVSGQPSTRLEGTIAQESSLRFVDQFNSFLMANLEWICIIWSFGMLMFFGKMLIGLYFQQQVQNSARPLTAGRLLQLLNSLQEKTHFSREIKLKVSDKIAGPAVMGWIKPCIYFPVTLVNQLSVEDAEAVLAHELAHILRRDYIVNIFQNVIEAFFYFHPAIWWISANIRNEREHACDDLAIDIVGDNLRYAKSLVFLQEWQNQNVNPIFAMSLSSPTSPLFDRIKRILNQPKTKNDMRQKFMATMILLFAFVLIAASKTSFQKNKSEAVKIENNKKIVEKKVITVRDTIPHNQNKEKSRIVELEDGKITKLEIDGKEIPESEFHKYEEEIEKLRLSREIADQQRMMLNKHNDQFDIEFRMTDSLMKNLKEFQMRDLEIEVMEMQQKLMFDLAEMKDKTADFQFHIMEDHRFKMDSLRTYFDSIGANIGAQIEMSLKDFEPHNFEFDTVFIKELNRKIEKSMHELDSKLPHLWDTIMAREIYDNMKKIKFDSFHFPQFDHDFDFHFDTLSFPDFHPQDFMFNSNLEGQLIKELKLMGLYKEGENAIALSNDSLIINGQKQSDDTLQRFKDVYEKATGTKFMSGSQLNIQLDGQKNKELRHKKI